MQETPGRFPSLGKRGEKGVSEGANRVFSCPGNMTLNFSWTLLIIEMKKLILNIEFILRI